MKFLIILLFFALKPSSVFAAGVEKWGDCIVNDVPTLKCLEVVFGNILFVASGIVILLLFIMFIVGSLKYLTSGGNPESIKKAQGTLMWAVIGTLLFAGSFLILKTIDCLFLGCQGKLFKFEIPEF